MRPIHVFSFTKHNLNGFTVKYTYPNLIYINWKHIPSEIKKSKQIVTNNKKQNSTKDRDFRFIEDYKPSLNFLDKII